MGNSCSNTLEIPLEKVPIRWDVQTSWWTTQSRLYYPCVESTGSGKPCWVPSKEYFNGLADFLKINRTVSEKIFNYLYGSFRIPAFMDASFKPDGKYPLIIFSHGLGAFRTLYSAICTEIASQGFLVASVEHRDESASATFYYQEKSVPEEQKQQDASKNSSHGQDNLEEVWMYYRVLKPGENEFPLRNKQVKQRADECIRALDILAEINSGCSVTNVLQSEFDWTTLENSMDMCTIAIMGHSFGGATVIESLCKEPRFKCGIALDSWMFPLDEEIFPGVKQPILFINSEKFQWAGNIIRMKKLDSATIPRKMITINAPELPRLHFPHMSLDREDLEAEGEIDPQVALDLSNKASLAFLQRHLLLEKNFCQWDHLLDGKDENLIPGTNVNLLESPM